MSVTVTQELTQQNVIVTGNPVENNVTVTVSNARGAAGADASNAITSATTSDGTADLSISNLTTATAEVTGTLTAPHIHGNLAGSVYAHVRAVENLAKGDPVYVSGSHGSGATLIAEVSKADASNAAKMPAVGIMDAAVSANANGHMVVSGTINDLATNAYAINAELYVAAGGGMTATPPSARAQPVARVERSNANNGAILVKVNGLSASDATANTLVRRTSDGGASFGPLSATALSGSQNSISSSAGTTITGPLTLSGTGSNTLAATYSNTITLTGTTGVTIAGGPLTVSSSSASFNTGTFSVNGVVVGRGGGAIATNTAVGASALEVNTTGSSNTALGRQALFDNTTGSSNTALGQQALANNTTASSNTAVGSQSLVTNTTGVNNTAVGTSSLFTNSTGGNNTALGHQSFFNNTTGSGNTSVGQNALFTSTTGNSNTALGQQALFSNTTGSGNVAVGQLALFSNTTGASNAAVGINSGRFIADGTTVNAVTTNSVYIGAETKALASGQSNQIVIGHNAIGLGSNTAVLGNDSVTTTALKGNVVVQRGAQDATNFERVGMRWVSTDARIGTTKGGTGVARDLVLETDGTERVRVTAAGNVGIGSGSALSDLNVIGSIAVTGTSFPVLDVARNTGATSDFRATARFRRTNSTGTSSAGIGAGVYFELPNSSNISKFAGFFGGSLSAVTSGSEIGELVFSPAWTGSDPSSRRDMVLRATGAGSADLTVTGNVGIGTTSPASKLTVTGGDAEVTDSVSGVILKAPNGTRYRITVDNAGALTTTAL